MHDIAELVGHRGQGVVSSDGLRDAQSANAGCSATGRGDDTGRRGRNEPRQRLDRISFGKKTVRALQRTEGHVTQRPVQPKQQVGHFLSMRGLIERTGQRFIQRARRLIYCAALADFLEETADVALQVFGIERNEHFRLSGACGNEQAEAIVREQVNANRRVGGGVLDRPSQASGFDVCRAALGTGSGGIRDDEFLNSPGSCLFGPAGAIEQRVELLALLRGDAAGLLQASQAVDLGSEAVIGRERRGIAVAEGAFHVIQRGTAALRPPGSIPGNEVVQLLSLEQLQDFQSFIEPTALHEPIGNGSIDADLVVQEATIEALIFAAEILTLALDLGDGALAEENSQRFPALRLQGSRGAEIRSPQRVGSAQPFGSRHGSDGQGGSLCEIAL